MKHVLAIGALLGVWFVLARGQVFTWPYYYDEADYMYAVSLGLRANYTDTPSQPLGFYVRTGLARGRDPGGRAALSEESRASGDVDFYRHWHGPLYFYWLLARAPLHLDEYSTRKLSYVFPVLTALVMYCGGLWLLPSGGGFPAGTLSAAFYLWSYPTTLTNEIAPHELFVLCTVAALVLLMKWRASGEARHWRGAVVAAACAFSTLEVALVLVAVLLACGGRNGRRRMTKSLLLFAGTVLALWPAAVLKLAFLKAYLSLAYLAVFRKSPWGDVTLLETWRLRWSESPWEWLVIAAAMVVYWRRRDGTLRRMLFPVWLYAGLMFLALLRVTTETPRYLLPLLPALHLAAGFTFACVSATWKPALQRLTAGGLCLLLLWNTAAQIRAHPIRPAPRLAALLDSVRQQHLDGKRVLAPQEDVPMIHYYFPAIFLEGYASAEERSALLERHSFDAVLERGA